jgi:hypothetical protein
VLAKLGGTRSFAAFPSPTGTSARWGDEAFAAGDISSICLGRLREFGVRMHTEPLAISRDIDHAQTADRREGRWWLLPLTQALVGVGR